MKRVFRAFLLVLMGVFAVAILPSLSLIHAQDDAELATYTFADGTTVRYPSDLELSEDSNNVRATLLSESTSFFIDAYSTDELAERKLTDLTSAIDYTLSLTDDEFVPPIENAIEVESNGVTVLWLRYEFNGYASTIQAAELPSGSILVVDAWGAFFNGTDEGLALAMLTDAVLGNSSFTVDVSNVPDVPFYPQPIGAAELSTVAFSDGIEARFGSDLEYEIDEGRLDFVKITMPIGSTFLDYYNADLVSEFAFEAATDAMLASWFPDDEDLVIDEDAVASISVGDVVLFYWRYEDSRYPGTIMAIYTPTGGILVVDSYKAAPGSYEESYAAAIALDFAGVPDLLAGDAVEFTDADGNPLPNPAAE